ncbi:putative receptor-like protein kinase At5g39000 isoform X1 [Lactuca sativa]|nr:putative receptor-like protein kinase At5g39000 isoform X1 [Lactuca sativa]
MSVLKQFEHLKIQLEAIESATNNFSKESCIGKGGFGKVYKGELLHSMGHTTVAIKRLDRSFGQGDSEFWKEVIMLSVYRHENIVSLLGFCDEKGEKILVYEYSSRRSLDLHLNNKDLTWVRRLTICIGAARGIAYLHNPAGTQQRLLHRDIKSSNILLDDNWNARISDLGLSKFGPANQNYTFLVTNNRVGTIGYCDPLYLESGILTKESDVYSFGVVLFEVLCGRLCFESYDKPQSFTQLVRKHYRQKNLNEIIWGDIKEEIHPTSLEVFSAIAYQCLKNDSEKRPLMEDVVTKLEIALEYQVNDTDISPVPQFQSYKLPGDNDVNNYPYVSDYHW